MWGLVFLVMLLVFVGWRVFKRDALADKPLRSWASTLWFPVALFLIGVMLLLCAGHARADAIAHLGDDWVRLTDRPCRILSVIARMPEGVRGYLRAASARVDGIEFDGCWLLTTQGVRIFYPDGSVGKISAEMFKADEPS